MNSELAVSVDFLLLFSLLSLTGSLGSAAFCVLADFLLVVCVRDRADIWAELLFLPRRGFVLGHQLFGNWLLILEVAIAPVRHFFIASSTLRTIILAIGTVSLHLLLTRIFLQTLQLLLVQFSILNLVLGRQGLHDTLVFVAHLGGVVQLTRPFVRCSCSHLLAHCLSKRTV